MGQLILIPVPLHESDGLYQHPLIRNTIKQARNVIVESLKMGKRHLNRLGHSDTQAVDWHLLNEHTNAMDRIQWIHSIAQDEYPWFLNKNRVHRGVRIKPHKGDRHEICQHRPGAVAALKFSILLSFLTLFMWSTIVGK